MTDTQRLCELQTRYITQTTHISAWHEELQILQFTTCN